MAPRNPPWTRDELILTLDMYFQQGPSHISTSHPTVTSLSESLNRLPVHSVRPDAERFRNANGVYMKLSNFLRFDDSYAGSGLTHGGKLEEEVWNEFASDKLRLRNVASAIRAVSDIVAAALPQYRRLTKTTRPPRETSWLDTIAIESETQVWSGKRKP